MPRKPRLAASLSVIGAASLVLALGAAPVHSQSPIEFIVREAARLAGRGGLEMPWEPRAPVPSAPQPHRSERQRQHSAVRFVCVRLCDNKRLALSTSTGASGREAAADMCDAAAAGAETALVEERLEPDGTFLAGSEAAGPAVLQEGRAALTETALASNGEPANTCPAGVAGSPLQVPIFADATLRRGDIVATADGFRTFVGRGRPPFDAHDFVATDIRRLGPAMQNAQIARGRGR